VQSTAYRTPHRLSGGQARCLLHLPAPAAPRLCVRLMTQLAATSPGLGHGDSWAAAPGGAEWPEAVSMPIVQGRQKVLSRYALPSNRTPSRGTPAMQPQAMPAKAAARIPPWSQPAEAAPAVSPWDNCAAAHAGGRGRRVRAVGDQRGRGYRHRPGRMADLGADRAQLRGTPSPSAGIAAMTTKYRPGTAVPLSAARPARSWAVPRPSSHRRGRTVRPAAQCPGRGRSARRGASTVLARCRPSRSARRSAAAGSRAARSRSAHHDQVRWCRVRPRSWAGR
jgi:hypothetical protein